MSCYIRHYPPSQVDGIFANPLKTLIIHEDKTKELTRCS